MPTSTLDACISKILLGGTFVWAVWFVSLISCIMAQHLYPESNFLSSVVAGAITGIFETLLMFPIENIKTQQQLVFTSAPSSNSKISNSNNAHHQHHQGLSFWQATKTTWRVLGFFGFYRGMGPVLFCAVPNQALRWTAFDTMCTLTDCLGEGRLWAVALSGVFTGIAVSLITGVPVETAKTLSIHQSMTVIVTKSNAKQNDVDAVENRSPHSQLLDVARTPTTSSKVAKLVMDEDEDDNNNNSCSSREDDSNENSQRRRSTRMMTEDSDIDVLEGASIQPVLVPNTPTTVHAAAHLHPQRNTKRRKTSDLDTNEKLDVSDGLPVEIITTSGGGDDQNSSLKKRHHHHHENKTTVISSNVASSNHHNLSWEDEVVEASEEQCKKNTGPMTWLVDFLNKNSNTSSSDENDSSPSSSSASSIQDKSMLRGWLPTILKKVGNQGIRFPVHRFLLNLLCGLGAVTAAGGKHHHHTSSCDAAHSPHHIIFGFIAGALSGITSIIFTQPVDVIKTRMQGLQAERYGHSLSCAMQLLREEGIQVFFHGMAARALRSALGAGFAFTFFPIVKAMLLQEDVDGHGHGHHLEQHGKIH